MKNTRHIRDVAEAIRNHANNIYDDRERAPHYGEVVAISPSLNVKLEGTTLVLSESDSDITLSQWVRAYDHITGLQVGDSLVLHEMADGDWLACDVISDSDVAGFGP